MPEDHQTDGRKAPASWLQEIDRSARRVGSIPGRLVPYDLDNLERPISSAQVGSMGASRIHENAPDTQQSQVSPRMATAVSSAGQSTLAHQLGPILARFHLQEGEDEYEATEQQQTPTQRPPMIPHVNSRLLPILEPSATPTEPPISDEDQLTLDRTLYLVISNKAYRSDVYERVFENRYCHPFKPGNTLVIDGDRGQDLGVVQWLTYNKANAEKYAEELNRRHMHDLIKYSRNYHLIENPPRIHVGGDRFEGPHRAFRHAILEEVNWLKDKEHLEMRMTREIQKIVNQMGIPMEVLDVDMQADLTKFIVYYFSDVYVRFTELNAVLNKRWGGRIWQCNVVANASPSGTGITVDPRSQRRQRGAQNQQHFTSGSSNWRGYQAPSIPAQTGFHTSPGGFPTPTSPYSSANPVSSDSFGRPSTSSVQGSLNLGVSAYQTQLHPGYPDSHFPKESYAMPRPLPPGIPPPPSSSSPGR